MTRALGMALVLWACSEDEPEIWIDRSPLELGVVKPGESLDFGLQLANDGGGTLVVEPFALRGDDDCAFTLEGPDVSELAGPTQGFIRGTFAPTREGHHEVALYLTSNAETWPRLIVPVCATVGEVASDEACEEPPPEAANCTP